MESRGRQNASTPNTLASRRTPGRTRGYGQSRTGTALAFPAASMTRASAGSWATAVSLLLSALSLSACGGRTPLVLDEASDAASLDASSDVTNADGPANDGSAPDAISPDAASDASTTEGGMSPDGGRL